MTPQTLSLALLGALAIAASTLPLPWVGSLDAGLLLMGSRLC